MSWRHRLEAFWCLWYQPLALWVSAPSQLSLNLRFIPSFFLSLPYVWQKLGMKPGNQLRMHSMLKKMYGLYLVWLLFHRQSQRRHQHLGTSKTIMQSSSIASATSIADLLNYVATVASGDDLLKVMSLLFFFSASGGKCRWSIKAVS